MLKFVSFSGISRELARTMLRPRPFCSIVNDVGIPPNGVQLELEYQGIPLVLAVITYVLYVHTYMSIN